MNELSETIPGVSIATVGFGLALYTYEMHRMSSFFSVTPGDSTALAPNILSLGALLLLVLIYEKRPRFRLHRHPWIGFLLAGVMSFSLFFSSASIIPLPAEAIGLASVVQHVGELLLLLCWAEVLIPLPGRFFAAITALSMLALGLLNGLSSLFKQNAVLTLIALVPLLSMACLYWFKDKRESFDTMPSPKTSCRRIAGIDAAMLPCENASGGRRSAILLFLAPLVGYPFIFGHVHYAWVPFQDGNQVSLAIQLAAAAGTVLAAGLLLMLITRFWGRRKIDLYNLLILPFVGITLYLTGILHDQWVFLYVIPLNICQKMALFLAMLTPYLIPPRKSPLSTWCVALFLYTLGKALSTSVSSELDGELYTVFVMVFIVLLAAASVAGVIVDDGAVARSKDAEGRNEPTGHSHSASSDSGSAAAERIEPLPEEASSVNTLEDVALKYRLTRREGEILALLAQGMTAAHIAEELVVSTSTAKTHMRNIYQKLGVHTQSELLLLVHRN